MWAELNSIKVRKFTEEVKFDEQAWQSGRKTKLVVLFQARKESLFFFFGLKGFEREKSLADD